MPKLRVIIALIAAAGLATVLINGYAAPFSSNQNTYFLHGLAATGYGQLSRDWLTDYAGTFPLLTPLITAMYWFGRPVGDALAFIFYVLSCGVYAVSIVAICRRFFPKLAAPETLLPFLAVLALFHSFAMALLTGGISAIPAKGVALFYPLGGIFQPQAFAVLLLLGVAAFVWGRPLWAAALIATGCVMHPAYLTTGGFLVLGMLVAQWRQGTPVPRFLLTGGVAFVIVLPMLVFIAGTYASSDPALTHEAHRILAEFRGPHHILLSHWLWHPAWGVRPDVLVKLSLCSGALWILRRTPLAWVLGAALAGMALITAVYGLTGNPSIGVSYPWRGFALLVPLSTALLTAWALSRFAVSLGMEAPEERPKHTQDKLTFGPFLLSPLRGTPRRADGSEPHKKIGGFAFARAPREGMLSIVILAGLAALGGYFSLVRYTTRFETTGALHAFVKHNVGPSDLYLVPSSNLTMMSFRLETGAPLFVDLKSHPVTPEGFLEWYRRIRMAAPAFGPDYRVNCARLHEVLTAVPAITHVVSADKEPPCPERAPELQKIYGDNYYSVWKRTQSGGG